MAKLSRLEITAYHHAITSRVKTIKALYQEFETGIITLTEVQEEIFMNEQKILEAHKRIYKCWQGKNGRYNTYLPKEGVKVPKGRLIPRTTEKALNQAIIDFYVEEKKERKRQEKKRSSPTFQEVYWKWREMKDLELGDNSVFSYNSNYNRFFQYTDFEEMPIAEIT